AIGSEPDVATRHANPLAVPPPRERGPRANGIERACCGVGLTGQHDATDPAPHHAAAWDASPALRMGPNGPHPGADPASSAAASPARMPALGAWRPASRNGMPDP